MITIDTNKILSSLSYFSILFAGILFPLIVWLVAANPEVKSHAKKALLSHLIPLIPLPILLFGVFTEMMGGGPEAALPVFFFIGIGLIMILSIVVLIWNIVKGIKVLR